MRKIKKYQSPSGSLSVQQISVGENQQGGKMNTLQFLKNGSGIHIKKKNRGKFTDYCGGQVTQECINKGKHSSNSAVRKTATFADNARHFKHKNGGKAFVEGVNILDSNPKAYKYVKKKYKMRMAQEGAKFDWTSTLANVGSSILQEYFQNKKASKEATASAETAKQNYKQEALSSLEETIKNKRTQRQNILNSIKNTADNPNAFGGVFEDTFIRQGDNEAINEYNQKIKNYNSTIDAQLQAQESENTGNFISGIMQQGMGVLNNYLSNKSSQKNAPTTISTKTSYNYFNTPKKFGTFNNDGSMNLGYNMTWSTDKGVQTKNWSDGIFNKSYTDYLK